MEELFAEAREKGLWFYTSYQGLWFSPDELAAHQSNGRFRWGPVNWQLRDPKERLEQLHKEIESARTNLKTFEKRI